MGGSGIGQLSALEVLDAGGDPALEVVCVLRSGATGRAVAASGEASGSTGLAPLLDGGTRHGGRGLRSALAAVEGEIAAALAGRDAFDQRGVDLALVDLDGTPTRSRLGAGTLLAVSLAVARAAAEASGLPLYRYLGGVTAISLPLPLVSLGSRGRAAGGRRGGADVMAVPLGAASFDEALRWALDVARALERSIDARAGVPAGEALGLAVEAIESAGRVPGEEVALAVDAAAYGTPSAAGVVGGSPPASRPPPPSAEVAAAIERWGSACARFPVVSLEDPLPTSEPAAWEELRAVLGEGVQLVDGELLSAPGSIGGAIDLSSAGGRSALGLDLARAGTLTEALGAVERTRSGGLACVAEAGTRETEDAALADLGVAAGCGQLRGGPPAGSEHAAKYSRLLRIERELGESALFPGAAALARPRS